MENKKEAVEVTVNELPDNKPLINEIIVELNTLESTTADTATPFINGILDAGIISSNQEVHITIGLIDQPDIIIYEKEDFKGTYYLPFRISSVSHSGNEFNFGPASWCLNNALFVSIIGRKNTNVKIKLRYR